MLYINVEFNNYKSWLNVKLYLKTLEYFKKLTSLCFFESL